jgi:hypothetical protein
MIPNENDLIVHNSGAFNRRPPKNEKSPLPSGGPEGKDLLLLTRKNRLLDLDGRAGLGKLLLHRIGIFL